MVKVMRGHDPAPKTASAFVWLIASIVVLSSLFAGSVFAQPGQITNSVGMEFILIQPGSFIMGSPRDESYRDPDERQYGVTISKPYYIQATEVTQGQWEAVLGENPAYFKECGSDCPVERVSYYDCLKLIRELNKKKEGTYRFPTEAEWEYACRASTATPFYWGTEVECEKANFNNNTRRGTDRCAEYVENLGFKKNSTVPVASYPPNPWGLYDMAGNVWEWCEDFYKASYPGGPVTDPTGPNSGKERVRRGGSWFKYGTYCRSANRTRSHPASRYRTTGVRLVFEPR